MATGCDTAMRMFIQDNLARGEASGTVGREVEVLRPTSPKCASPKSGYERGLRQAFVAEPTRRPPMELAPKQSQPPPCLGQPPPPSPHRSRMRVGNHVVVVGVIQWGPDPRVTWVAG